MATEAQDDEGMISVVISPMQLAAVLEKASISPGETAANRIWGAVGLVGGTLELLGSSALLVDPDPTVSKVVGAVGIVHGADVFMTSWNQLTTGQTQDTVTSQTAAALAKQLGLDPKTAATVGAVVDIAVPTGVATAVARSQMIVRLASVNQVRAGYISLTVEEQLFGDSAKFGKAAAHTIRDHVGKTLQEMLDRFQAKPSLQATSSFKTVADAEKFVSEVLRANKRKIQTWVASKATKPLTLTMRFAYDAVGEGVINPTKNAFGGISIAQTTTDGTVALRVAPGIKQAVNTVTVVLNKTALNGRTWYVLTAFPDILRDLGLIPMP